MLQTFHRRFRQPTNDFESPPPRSPNDSATALNHLPAVKASDRRFTHKHLDETQSSIRLVTVSSELSSDGTIQCYISHSTLDRASYVCLSYVWGPEPASFRILINGLPFYVRKNVFDFLDMVRTMPMTFYWIDAMCIDQSNVPERNKQVAQMGQIYSKAFLVYLWLGKLPPVAPYMRLFSANRGMDPSKKSPWEDAVEAREAVKTWILNHEYWSRAWATQEICLARAVLVTLCRESFKLPDFIRHMRKFDEYDPGSFRNSTLAPFAEVLGDSSKVSSKSLLLLLDSTREKKCEVPRDRVYSLLSLCSNFQLPEVKYDQTSEDLAYDVLRRADEPLCICSALLVAQTLRLADKKIQEDDAPQTYTAVEFDLKGLRFARHAMLCNDRILSWSHYQLIGTDIFGHDQLLPDLCPTLHIVMEALQHRAIRAAPEAQLTRTSTNGSYGRSSPYMLKMMDDHHAQALLDEFGSGLNIEVHPAYPDSSIFRIALRLLVKLVPQGVPLCRRVALAKAKKDSERELASPTPYSTDPAFAQQSRDARVSVDYRPREASLHKIDSATSNRSWEEEGPVSSMRLRRIALPTASG